MRVSPRTQAILITLLLSACSAQSERYFVVDQDASPSVRTATLEQLAAKITTPITPAELNSLTTLEPRHQFAAHFDQQTLLCVSYRIGSPEGHYYFLFVDNELESVIERPPFDYEEYMNRRGRRVRRDKPIEPRQCVQLVRETTGLSKDAFIESAKKAAEEYREAMKLMEPNLLPAFVIVAPLLALQAPRKAIDEAKRVASLRFYDALKVKLGMTAQEVDVEFGEPALVETVSETERSERRVYGRDLHLMVGGEEPSWIEVQFVGDQAVAVYSHDFFDRRLRERVTAP